MFVAPVVDCEISAPPTTPRGTSRSSCDCLTTFMCAGYCALSRGHTGELAAGDVEHLPVNEVRPRRAEEEHAAGGLLRGARPAERDHHRRDAAHLVGDPELDGLAADLDHVRRVLL